MFTKSNMIQGLLACLLISLFAGSGCNMIYKQNIQQGNALEEEDLSQLYIGMNKRQVLFVLGSPSIHDPFQQQRWDYVQTFSRRGQPMVQRTVTLRFEADLLAEIIGVDKTPTALVDEEPSEVIVSSDVPGQAEESDSILDSSPEARAAEVKAEESFKPEADVNGIGAPSAEERAFEDEGDDEVMRVEQDINYEQDRLMEQQTPPNQMSSPDIDG